MTKIIKILFLSLLAFALIVATAVFILFETFDADQYFPQITKKVSLILGRPVSIGHLGLGLSSRGITLDAGPLTVADDVDFTTRPFIKIDRVRVSFDLGSLFLYRKIHITGILLESPQFHFIRSLEGRMNIQSIVQKRIPHFNVGAELVSARSIRQTQGPSHHLINENRDVFSLPSITIQNASISFIDQNQTMPLDVWLSNINMSFNDFSFTRPFRLSFDACFYSNEPNVSANTLVSLDLSKRSILINDLSLHMDLSKLDMNRLKGVFPGTNDNSIFKNIAGIVQLNAAYLGIVDSGDFKARGDVTITGGIIKNFNIIKTALSRTLGVFAGMESNFENLFKGQLKDRLDAKDTLINKAHAQFSIHDKTIVIDDSLIETDILTFTAKGSLDEGLNMNFQTMLYLNEDVSAVFVNQFEGFKILCDDTNRIAIEASLEGVIPHLKYKPSKDFRKKSRKALMKEGGNILGILLGGR